MVNKLVGFSALTMFYVATSVALERPVNSLKLDNKAAFIPSQCYVKTEVEGHVYNTCYTCHTDSKAPNFMNDADTQLEYGFNKYARRNRWENLFIDRTEKIKNITDESIVKYVRKSNYIDGEKLLLTEKLKQLPVNWDSNNNKKWDGYFPDSYFNFDKNGFDRNPDGKFTGWRSFVYTPFPGGFIPAAGAADDVLIRLPIEFQRNESNKFDVLIYKLNLAIVESLIKQKNVHIPPVDENKVKVDLNRDGQFSVVSQIVFMANMVDGSGMNYVGLANKMHTKGKQRLSAGLYPVGTEFLHSVRYLDIKGEEVSMAVRMKELRYAKKIGWADINFQRQFAQAETLEREQFPEQIPVVQGNHETGVLNGLGWRYQGFIEDKNGALRPQNYEEHVFCVGCHSAIGAIHDSSFAFARKDNNPIYQFGWQHWQQVNLKQLFSGKHIDLFLDYKNTAGGITDFSKKSTKSHNSFDVSELIPSSNNALNINKIYKTIVEEQSFIKGRDPVMDVGRWVYRVTKPGQKTGVSKEKVSLF